MEPYERQSRGHGVQFLITAVLCALIIAGYVAAMRALLDVSLLNSEDDIERRDEAYLVLHGGALFIAAFLGFFAGKWFNGLGLAYALLFLIIVAVGILVVLLGSYELACQGHNGLIRHWECGPP